ncbi:MAG: HAD family hydrolase [Clostridium sp.]|uniref:HAD family hydrolase n=1 Tax=Clostridium sp. TaxID=1506 RepID=UPI003F3D28E9
MLLDNINAVIFDLDGTLIDSLWVWHQIDIDYLGSKGIKVPTNLHKEIGHLSFAQTAAYFKSTFNIPDSTEIIIDTWNKMAYEFYSTRTPLKNGAKEFIQGLKKKGIKIGLATSNSQRLLEAALNQHNIYHLFDSITLTSEVDKGKDCPDVYLLASKKLNVPPSECLVFEDILPAVKGALKANMKVVTIEDHESLDDSDELKHLSFKYLKDYTPLLKEI